MIGDISAFYKKIVKRVFRGSSIDEEYIEDALNQILELKGVIAVSLIDWQDEIVLGAKNNIDFNIVDASKSNAKMIKLKMDIIQKLDLDNSIEEILVTLDNQIHIINILSDYPELCLYVALDSNRTNLALARGRVKVIGDELIEKQLLLLEESNNG